MVQPLTGSLGSHLISACVRFPELRQSSHVDWISHDPENDTDPVSKEPQLASASSVSLQPSEVGETESHEANVDTSLEAKDKDAQQEIDPDEVITGRLGNPRVVNAWKASYDSDSSDGSELSSTDDEDDEDDFVPMANVTEDVTVKPTAYLNELAEMIHSDDYDKAEAGMSQLAERIAEKPAQLTVVETELARAVLHLDNKFNMEGFAQRKQGILVALLVNGGAARDGVPTVARYLHSEFFSNNCLVSTRIDVLDCFVNAAVGLSTLPLSEATEEALQKAEISRVGTVTKRWGVRRSRREATGLNRFLSVATSFFLPFLQRSSNSQGILEKNPLVLGRLVLALGVMLECARNGKCGQSKYR